MTPIETSRTRLCLWAGRHDAPFAAMQADPEVMRDQDGPVGAAENDEKRARYLAAYERHGFCRWAVETKDGAFLGYAGVQPSRPDHVIGPHFEAGWRFARREWGKGYATEAAAAAIGHAFARGGMTEIVAYTAPDNLRSQAVMARLNLRRDAGRDFYDRMYDWRGLVWVADAGWSAPAARE